MSEEIVQYFQYLQSLLNKSPINVLLLCLNSFPLCEFFFVTLIFNLCFWGFALWHIVFEYSKFSLYELLNYMIEWFRWYGLYMLTHCTLTLLGELNQAIFSCTSWHINFVFYGEVYCERCWWESKLWIKLIFLPCERCHQTLQDWVWIFGIDLLVILLLLLGWELACH